MSRCSDAMAHFMLRAIVTPILVFRCQGGRNEESPFPWWDELGKGDQKSQCPDRNLILGPSLKAKNHESNDFADKHSNTAKLQIRSLR